MGLHEDHKAARQRNSFVAAGAVALLAVLLQTGGAPVRNALAWDRGSLEAGQVWRLVTGHLVHLGWSHVLLNVAGLAPVAWIAGGAWSLWRWAVIALLTIATIDAGFWYLYSDLDWYVGLSGLLHGLLVAGLFAGVVERDREAVVLAVLVAGKLAWEQVAGPLPGSESTSGGAVIVNAHLYGAIGGLLGALVVCRRVRREPSI